MPSQESPRGELSSPTNLEPLDSIRTHLLFTSDAHSSVVNLFGTSLLLGQLGMMAAIMVTPTCLFVSAFSVYLKPAVVTTLIGRSFELSLRWSINSTARNMLWIAVPTAQLASSKPWIEGEPQPKSTPEWGVSGPQA